MAVGWGVGRWAGRATLPIFRFLCTTSPVLKQLPPLDLPTLPALSKAPEVAEDTTSRLTRRNLPGGLSCLLPLCLQKGKLRPQRSAGVSSQGWSVLGQPGPGSGPPLREVGWCAHSDSS